jgi:hypothetical protein
MNKQRVMLAILLFLVLAHLYCAIFGVGYRHRGKPFNDLGKLYPVRSIRLLQNNMFEVTMADGESTTILGRLNGGIKSGSKNKIINILNKAKNPSLCVLGKYGDTTLIDFIFILDGNDIKFSDWLQSNRLWLTTI